ncbi:MAG: sensor histidine kinase [Ilumatobacteraceae bacterium]
MQTLGDAAQLARAVRNLGDNAARHAASRIAFTTNGEAATARLTIADDGPGIPVDQRERVFERFTRLDDARAAADGGAGLGLAITRDIVERHDGTVTVATTNGGATFVICLPAHRDLGADRRRSATNRAQKRR